jgi:hypothetical protein
MCQKQKTKGHASDLPKTAILQRDRQARRFMNKKLILYENLYLKTR